MTEDGETLPDLPSVEPATVAWNLFRQTIGGRFGEAIFADVELARETFLAGYRAGVADAKAGR